MSDPARPKPRPFGSYRARVVRGPRKDGRWYWRIERHKDGTEKTEKVGWWTVEELDVQAGRLVAGVPDDGVEAGLVTVRDLTSCWHGAVEEREDLAPATVSSYGEAANRINAIIGDVRLSALDRRTVERLRDTSIRVGQTPRTAAKNLTVLGLAWRWGRECGHLTTELPRVHVILPEIHRPRAQAESVETAIGVEVEGKEACRLHLLLVADTGCRPSEIAKLRRCDVDGRWITITGKRRTRRIPLGEEAAGELAAWMRAHPGTDEGWVLVWRPSTSRQYLHLHLKAIGVEWTPRGLRDAKVDKEYREQGDFSVAAKLLGHSPEVALRHYRRVTEEELLDAVDRQPPKSKGPRTTSGSRRVRRSRRVR